MKKCIIIDDDAVARTIVNKLCSESQELEVMEEFSNAIDAIKYLNTVNNIDCIFLDIHMPTFSGFDFINTLKKSPKIILISSDKSFALDAFEYNCVLDYIAKPITKERFDLALSKLSLLQSASVSNNYPSETNELYINIDRRLVKITIPEILVIEANGDYIKIKTEQQNFIVHSTLKKIEQKLPSTNFLKVHRSYIINIKKIIDIEDNSILINQDIIPVSRANRAELMQRLNLL